MVAVHPRESQFCILCTIWAAHLFHVLRYFFAVGEGEEWDNTWEQRVEEDVHLLDVAVQLVEDVHVPVRRHTASPA